jgi:uncharacterized protein YdeI (YjbR/CyaY-like superfamily)
MNPKVDFHFKKGKRWYEEMVMLRAIVLESGLVEELKWGQPCYTLHGKNVLLLHGFKDYCAILFMKGVLMKDPKRILIQQIKNVQEGRQIRFSTVADVAKLQTSIKSYIKDAIAIEKAGLKVPHKETEDFEMVPEFAQALHYSSRLETAFYELTPGRQRAYLLYFASAKQAKTRETRILKCTPAILSGKGLLD